MQELTGRLHRSHVDAVAGIKPGLAQSARAAAWRVQRRLHNRGLPPSTG
jgi:hypothetical protein